MTPDEALDGKLDLIRRFNIDIRALNGMKSPHMVLGTGQLPEIRAPLNEKYREELNYDVKMLQYAEVFAWDPRIVKMVQDSAESFPRDVPFSRAWMYVPSGIWWLGRENPRILLQSSEADPTGGEQRRRCCAVTFWSDLRDPENICVWGASYDHNEPSSGPVGVANIILKGGETLDYLEHELTKDWSDAEKVIHQVKEMVRKRTQMDEAWIGADRDVIAMGFRHNYLTEQQYTEAIRALKHRAWAKSAIKLAKFFLAGSMWLQQTVLAYAHRPPSRSARKRAERVAVVPTVAVVELRRRQYVDGAIHEPGGEVREYNCQWVVRGHWRNQYFPSTGDHRPIWIDPYVKGPDDKPFKGGDRVFAVRR